MNWPLAELGLTVREPTENDGMALWLVIIIPVVTLCGLLWWLADMPLRSGTTLAPRTHWLVSAPAPLLPTAALFINSWERNGRRAARHARRRIETNPGEGASGSLFPLQVLTVRDILADCEGVVRRGGDDDPADESLFCIDRGPDDASVRSLADRLWRAEAMPGEGAGVTVDVLAPSRPVATGRRSW